MSDSVKSIIKSTMDDTEKIVLQFCLNLLLDLGYEDGLKAIKERLEKHS